MTKRNARRDRCPPIDWSNFDHLLGTVADGDVAKIIGCTGAAVLNRRKLLNISAFTGRRTPNAKLADAIPLLGTMPDTRIAALFGCYSTAVRERRIKLGIPKYELPDAPPPRPAYRYTYKRKNPPSAESRSKLFDLATLGTQAFCGKYGVHVSSAHRLRRAHRPHFDAIVDELRRTAEKCLSAAGSRRRTSTASRRATIIGTTTDYRGHAYDVREARPTAHGFDVLIGWPAGHRGKGTQGPQVIATKPLVDLLLAHAHQPAIPSLPIGKTAAKRVRKLLGINRYTSITDWWDRQGAPGTLADAGETLGRSASAVSQQERRRGVRRLRPAGWWREEPARSVILDLSTADAAKALGVAVSSVRRMRWMIRQTDGL